MNYSEFLNMVPEFALVVSLLIVFCVDFICPRCGTDRTKMMNILASLLMVGTAVVSATSEPSSAFGGIYVTSQAINVMKSILAFGSLIVVVMANPWVEKNWKHAGEFYMLIISTLLGMFVMMSSGSFLMFFLGLEMASVPLACMVAFDRDRKESAEGAAKYILVATFSSGVMLFGISFIYAATGTLYFDDVATVVKGSPLCIMGMAFFFSGLGFKISLVPFHFWTADTYQGAPTTVTGYLSVVSKGAAAFTLAAILMKVFAPVTVYWQYMLFIVVVLSITIANLFAIRQSDLKRFMAFSSISQAGYIVLAIVGNNTMSVTALSFYVLIYIVANMSVFTVISAVEEHNNGTVEINSYNGLYATNPRLAFLLTLALFSLGGIPPFAGMFSKFFVFMAAVKGMSIDSGIGALSYAVVFIALVNTVISLYYYLLIVKAMFIKHNDAPLPTFRSNVSTRLALAICTAGIILFGFCSVVYGWIDAASAAL